MIMTQSDLESAENRESSQGHAANQRCLRGHSDDTACKGVQVLASLASRKKIWGQEEVPSLSICLSIYFSNQQQTVGPFENKMRDIFIKTCFVPSLNFVLSLWLYNTRLNGFKHCYIKLIIQFSISHLIAHS